MCKPTLPYEPPACYAMGPGIDGPVNHLHNGLLRSKLALLLARTTALFNSQFESISLMQVWMGDARSLSMPQKGVLHPEYRVDPEIAVVADPQLQPLRSASLQRYLCGRLSMPGRVFCSGCVEVVQNLRVLPTCVHPRSRMAPSITDRVAEALYLPVYDMARPHDGTVAVLEVLLSKGASDSMPHILANLTSFLGSQLTSLQLSLASLIPAPIGPSSLAGRHPKPPACLLDDSSDDEDAANHARAAALRCAAWTAASHHKRPAPGCQVRQTAQPMQVQHPGMVGPAAINITATAAAAMEAGSGCASASADASMATATEQQQPRLSGSSSADSTCTSGSSGSGASPRAFVLERCSCGSNSGSGSAGGQISDLPIRQTSAATAPPELCYDENDEGECDGPPRSKRARRGLEMCGSPSAMRRIKSMPRALSGLLGGSDEESCGVAGGHGGLDSLDCWKRLLEFDCV